MTLEETLLEGTVMDVLIPILTKKETDAAFLETAVRGVQRVVVLLVVDTGVLPQGFGVAADEIMQGRQVMDEVREAIGKKRKTCQDVLEWGSTIQKINQVAQLKNVEKIILKNDAGPQFRSLVNELRKGTPVEVEVL
ncbi:MAG: hypothetical protein HY393_00775 [Candidatus Diapherotrites archaeon]|nr:hypothetical protein [Candidatus Diapherotrites archaeon]